VNACDVCRSRDGITVVNDDGKHRCLDCQRFFAELLETDKQRLKSLRIAF
jgi:hypothetical protein